MRLLTEETRLAGTRRTASGLRSSSGVSRWESQGPQPRAVADSDKKKAKYPGVEIVRASETGAAIGLLKNCPKIQMETSSTISKPRLVLTNLQVTTQLINISTVNKKEIKTALSHQL